MPAVVNGKPEGALDPADRGTAYGDGVFRTLLIRGGKPVCWERHFRKLRGDCAAIEMPCPASDVLEAELAQAGAGLQVGAGKIIVTRGAGSRGYAPPANPRPSRIVSVEPLASFPSKHLTEGVEVRRCRLRLSIQPRLAGIKHLNRIENVLARMEWTDPQVAEGLMLDTENWVIEGVSTNLFVACRGVLSTPELSRCGVSGVTRERIIDRAVRTGVPVRVARLSWEELLDSDEAILLNSLIGAWQIRRLETRAWARGEWASRFRNWLNESDD